MSKLWVKFGEYNPTRVSTEGCELVDDFIEAVQKKLQILNPPQEISISLTEGGNPLRPGLTLNEICNVPAFENSDKDPLCVSISPLPSRLPSTVYLEPTTEEWKFWDAFKKYSNPIQKNTVVQLPKNVFILGDESIGSSIFIRPCYPKLLETAISIVESKDIRHLIILGNPGIGKTYFGYFLLLHLVHSGSTVIYETHLYKEWLFLFTPKGVFKGTRKSLHDQFMSSKTFYIVDGMAPVVVPAKTILLSSLRREIWHQFSKNSCDFRCMPVWSYEELNICRSMLFPSLPEELVESLYKKWGGIARYTLTFALVEEQQTLLNQALDISNIDQVVQSLGEKTEVSSRLIHKSAKEDFHSGLLLFASDYVVDEIFKRLFVKDRDHLIRFLSASQ
jgi:hypothetical protein